MTEPDEALKWAREYVASLCEESDDPEGAQLYRSGQCDDLIDYTPQAYRAGQAASAERIKALEEENAALQELAATYQVRMSNMLTRLEERYPEDFVWLKEADQ